MIEYLPHLWVSEYYTFKPSSLSSKKIQLILHLSSHLDFYKTNIEQIRIPMDKNDSSLEEKNALMYNHMFDVTDLIHQKIMQTSPVLILSNSIQKDVFASAYFIRFAKVLPREAMDFIQSKKKELSMEIIEYNNCLNKFYYQLRNF
jgi:hypothetical protein